MAPVARADTDVVAVARTAIGRPYRWGATGPDAFDCSGLVFWSFAQLGIEVPRTSYDQATGGQPVDRADLEPGDVVVYYPSHSHVGIYTGDGRVIHASTYGHPVAEVAIDAAGPYNTARRYRRKTAVTLYGPDLSNNNWNSTSEIAGWLDDCFEREGYSWMEHKVSQGSGYRDPFWPTVRDWCAANDVPCIGYHYVDTSNPATQAECFKANGGGSSVMLDFEDGSGDITNFWAVVNAFNAAGITVRLSYLPHWYWQNIGSPDLAGVPGLVSSSYYETGTYGSIEYADAGGDAGPGWASYGGATPVIWQFSDGAVIDGKSVDANAFKGQLADLQALLGGTVTAPQPNPPAIPKPADEPTQESEVWDQLLIRWDQLGGHTIVEALAAIGQKLGIEGFAPPAAS
ncbi:hypothetical protein E2F47_06135 [Mycobacterium eburneum]|nr:hypothetical protein E2F47_06135 [Mycobacterium eburneum]